MSVLRNFLVLCFLLAKTANANFPIKSGEALNLTSNEILVIDGDLTIESGGVLNGVSGSQIQVGSNWKNSGSYNHGNGSVYFTGSSVSQIAGPNTFYNLISDFSRADTSSGKTLIFESGISQSVVNHLQIKGATSNNLVILSTAPGTRPDRDPARAYLKPQPLIMSHKDILADLRLTKSSSPLGPLEGWSYA